MQNLLPQHRRDENDGGRSSAAVMPDRETTRPMSEACEGALCKRAMRERKLASAGSPMPAVDMPAHAKSPASEKCDPTVELDGGRADIPCLCALGLGATGLALPVGLCDRFMRPRAKVVSSGCRDMGRGVAFLS